MEKTELIDFIHNKMLGRDCVVTRDDDRELIIAGNMPLPDSDKKAHVMFEVGEGEGLHTVRWVIKYPIKLSDREIDSFYRALNEINSGFSVGRFYIDGDTDEANFCSVYQTVYFNTDYEAVNLDRTLMFVFDSLMLEFSQMLKKV